ncbi:MAG: hypothetical protein WD510_01460 [Balneolaceae bacterium]
MSEFNKAVKRNPSDARHANQLLSPRLRLPEDLEDLPLSLPDDELRERTVPLLPEEELPDERLTEDERLPELELRPELPIDEEFPLLLPLDNMLPIVRTALPRPRFFISGGRTLMAD